MDTLKRFLIWPFRMVFNAIRWVFMAVLGSITWVLQTLWRTVMWIATIPMMLWRGVVATYHMLWSGICMIGKGCIAVPVWLWHTFTAMIRAIMRSPRQTYERCRSARDWLLAKVEYLQAESAKWKTVFQIAKSPYRLLIMAGFSPQLAVTFLFAGTAVGGGAIVAEVLEPPSFSRGDSGVYSAPQDNPVEWSESMQTLRVDLGATPVGLLELDSISINTQANSTLPAGETNALILGGLAGTSDPVFVETYLEVGNLYIDKWRCSKLTMEHIEVNHLILTKNASDGISHSMVAGTPRARGISGGVRANEMKVSNSTYDQVVISSAISSVDGRVDEIRMVNIWSKEPCLLSRIRAGTITINLSEFGNGDGLTLKDWIISNTVVFQTLTADQNIEILISPPS